ncbi:MAG: sterol desaturase family protein, partial [Halieaceae bacterium]|nr:sterol desaturase family protein [Halieaceae bacterium]
HEAGLRLGFFIGVLALMATWEILAPRRRPGIPKAIRWTSNLGLVLLNTLLLRLLFPAAGVGAAVFASTNGLGLLNHFQLSLPLATLVTLVALDLVVYLQHVLLHAAPTLWRVHRVHHADLDYDVTTGSRFHPIEIILSMLVKFAAIILLGAPAAAVVIFELLLNALAMFNHGNVRLPLPMDKVLRLFVVTPDMHRVHHCAEDNETNSNFGFNLSIWDRIFGTYIDQPLAGHTAMTIGIHQYREPRQVCRLPGMLMLPFVGKVSGYAINRRASSKNGG